jgi:hypothetical protein
MSPRGGHVTLGGVEVTTEVIVVLLLLGSIGGFYYGRMWSEDVRAERAMAKTWAERKDYRKKPGK